MTHTPLSDNQMSINRFDNDTDYTIENSYLDILELNTASKMTDDKFNLIPSLIASNIDMNAFTNMVNLANLRPKRCPKASRSR